MGARQGRWQVEISLIRSAEILRRIQSPRAYTIDPLRTGSTEPLQNKEALDLGIV